MPSLDDQRRALIDLSHTLGAEHRDLAILGEGNTSARISDDTFIVKASGSSLGTLAESDIVECRFAPLLALMAREDASPTLIDETLMAARIDPSAKKPSIEALFHAYLLTLPGVGFVGHTHPIAVNAILCSPMGEHFAQYRMFPDEIVCCGARSVFVPYADPGLKLSQLIREQTELLMDETHVTPRVILLQNHGLIAIGSSTAAVKATTFMTVKSARIFTGSVPLGGPVFLNQDDIDSIANRSDEHYRQRALKL